MSIGSDNNARGGRCVVLLAGGGTGGHVYPNLAVAERLDAEAFEAVYLVSHRAVDRRVLTGAGVPASSVLALAAEPLSVRRPWATLRGYWAARRAVRGLIAGYRAAGRSVVMVATGGFVSAPAASAAWGCGVPVGLVNLDAVAGKANRWAARFADRLFTTHAQAGWPDAELIGLPLRYSVIGGSVPGSGGVAAGEVAAARMALGLPADREVLLVFAGSQGGRSVNEAMAAVAPALAGLAGDWSVLHVAGPGSGPGSGLGGDAGGEGGDGSIARLEAAYREAGLSAVVLPYCDRMGEAWRVARLCVGRAGAGTVAEAWATRTACVFLPYPYHRDQHQKLNAAAMVEAGGGVLLADRVDPQANAVMLGPTLVGLMGSPRRLEALREALAQRDPGDGAAAVAAWVMEAGKQA